MLTSDSSFLNRYEVTGSLTQNHLLPGQPQVHEGYDLQTGSRVLIKIWPRNPDIDDRDLHLIWHNEVRQLQRLADYPGARDFLLPMAEAGTVSEFFYLAFSSGNSVPLPCLAPAQAGRQLSLRRAPKRLVWQNLRRLAKGLGILHSQGLIHRKLDEWSVYTEGREAVDYQLGGFEWSLRLGVGLDRTDTTLTGSNHHEVYSFSTDWRSLGLLAMRLLNISIEEISRKEIEDDSPSKLEAAERLLLRDLIAPAAFDRLDSQTVIKRIDQVLADLAAGSPPRAKACLSGL